MAYLCHFELYFWKWNIQLKFQAQNRFEQVLKSPQKFPVKIEKGGFWLEMINHMVRFIVSCFPFSKALIKKFSSNFYSILRNFDYLSNIRVSKIRGENKKSRLGGMTPNMGFWGRGHAPQQKLFRGKNHRKNREISSA